MLSTRLILLCGGALIFSTALIVVGANYAFDHRATSSGLYASPAKQNNPKAAPLDLDTPVERSAN